MMKLIYSLLLIGAVQSANAREPISPEEQQEIVDQFTYDAEFNIESHKLTSSKRAQCWVEEFQMTTTYPSNPSAPILIDAVMYRPNPNKIEAPTPLVIYLPPIGGTNVLDKRINEEFCSNQMSTVLIKNDFSGFASSGDLPPPEAHNDAAYHAVAGVKAALTYGKKFKEIDSEKLGIMGVSLGGILGSFAFGVLDELGAGYFLVSGSDIPLIMTISKDKRVSNLRRKRMKAENLKSPEEYEAYLRKYMFLDNYDVVSRVPRELTFLRISKDDTHVHTQQQLELFEMFNQPQATYSESGHVGTVINNLLWGSNRKIVVEFFEQKFSVPNIRLETGSETEPIDPPVLDASSFSSI